MNIIVSHGFETNYTVGFVRGLLMNGIDICVISSDEDDSALRNIGAKTVNLRGSSDPNRTAIAKFTNLVNYYARLISFIFIHRGSVIHFTGIFQNKILPLDGIILNLYVRLASSKYIYTVHNVLPHGKQNSRWTRWVYTLAYRIPDHLLVHTELSKHQLNEDFSISKKKITTISIGLNEEVPTTKILSSECRAELGYQADEKVILFFGKADEYKGIETLIKAFDLLKDSRKTVLNIATWFPDHAFRESIVALIEASRNKDRIRLHEKFIPNNEVELYFKSANVLCLPYKNIYQSGVVFLSMKFGLPIVATDVGSLSEYITEEFGLIAVTNDSVGIADCIAEFFKFEDEYQRETIKNLAKEYQWEKICKKLLPLYKKGSFEFRVG